MFPTIQTKRPVQLPCSASATSAASATRLARSLHLEPRS
jgi:hypothetical protein